MHTPFSMKPPKTKSDAASALVSIRNVLLTAFVVAILYFARDLLIPLALAALLTFLLAPLVSRLERWMGRIAAVLLVAAMIFSVIAMAGWVLTRQLVDLAARLPDYKVNIETKIHSLQLPSGGVFKRLSQTVEELKKDLRGSDEPTVSQNSGKPATAVALPAKAPPKLPVRVVETSEANPLQLLQVIISPLLGPLGTTGLVVLLVIFMLLKREDLRSRLIRLIWPGTHKCDHSRDGRCKPARLALPAHAVRGQCDLRHGRGHRSFLHRRAKCDPLGGFRHCAALHSLYWPVDCSGVPRYPFPRGLAELDDAPDHARAFRFA